MILSTPSNTDILDKTSAFYEPDQQYFGQASPEMSPTKSKTVPPAKHIKENNKSSKSYSLNHPATYDRY